MNISCRNNWKQSERNISVAIILNNLNSNCVIHLGIISSASIDYVFYERNFIFMLNHGCTVLFHNGCSVSC